jgi:FAD:protein FMN transferase
MGTLFTITLYAPDKDSGQSAAEAAFKRIAALDDIMSDYQADSELMRLCQSPVGVPVHVSHDLFDILEQSQKFSELTHGSFDVTVGPLVRLWRFSRKRHTLASASEITAAKAAMGYKHFKLDQRAQTVTLGIANMRLDLGGIAKGYAADQALALLKDRGLDRAFVAASGDIAVGNSPPGEAGWKIGISAIDSHNNDTTNYVLLRNQAISTSGDTEQAIEINGVRYSHIVDPGTGLGLTNRIQVSVVAPNGTTTDALATGLSVMGAQRGLELVNSMHKVGALFLVKTDAGTKSYASSEFKKVWNVRKLSGNPGAKNQSR